MAGARGADTGQIAKRRQGAEPGGACSTTEGVQGRCLARQACPRFLQNERAAPVVTPGRPKGFSLVTGHKTPQNRTRRGASGLGHHRPGANRPMTVPPHPQKEKAARNVLTALGRRFAPGEITGRASRPGYWRSRRPTGWRCWLPRPRPARRWRRPWRGRSGWFSGRRSAPTSR